jgi:hypothetical protein
MNAKIVASAGAQKEMYFNLALVPEEKAFANLCIELAQENCKSQSDGYLLGEEALPHVTVCQFQSAPAEIERIWSHFADLSEPRSLLFRHLYVQYGKEDMLGKLWMGLAVTYEPSVTAFHKECFERLAKIGIDSRNTPDRYFPHLTFARCDAAKTPSVVKAPPESLWLTRYKFKLTIGESDELGRYHRRLA